MKTPSESKNFRIILIFAINLLLIFFFLTTSIISYFLYKQDIFLEKGRKIGKDYRYFQLDPRTNESSVGFVTLDNQLIKEDEFLSYQDDDGILHLISDFGTTGYRCSGTCYCEEENNERRTPSSLSSTVVRTSLTYLVASLTTFIAFEKAREYFTKECVRQLSDTCSFHVIKSEVDECENELEDDDEDEWFYFQEPDDGKPKDKYWCKGHCLDTPIKHKNPEFQDVVDNFDCKELKHDGEIILKVNDDGKTFEAEAMLEFQNKEMFEFCKWASKFIFEEEIDADGKEGYGEMYEDVVLKPIMFDWKWNFDQFHLCRGGEGDDDKAVVLTNPSVRCQKTAREYSKEKKKEDKFWDSD